MARRTPPAFWKSIAVAFPRAAKPSALLAEFGSVGPYAWLTLILEAKQQEYSELDRAARSPGRVKLAWAAFGQLVGCDAEAARELLQRLEELGELEVVDHGHAFTAVLRDWERWELEPRDPAAALAKRERRASGPVSGQRPDNGTHKDKDKDKDEATNRGAR